MGAELARPAIRELVPYSSARSLALQAAAYLDANESSEAPLPHEPELAGLQRYPAPQPPALVRQLAGLYGVGPQQLFVGRGVDEAIDCLLRVFCEARRDAILVPAPTYGFYAVSARIQGAEVLEVPLQTPGFGLDVASMLAACGPAVKLVFVCSPNNPTGNCIAPEAIETLARCLRGRALLVLDEAYIEFASAPSFAARLEEHPNLVVLRTLSKAWALAGARCGVALAAPEIIELLHRVRAPYPLSLPAVRCVQQVLGMRGESVLRARIQRVRQARDALADRLAKLPDVLEVFPSEANFLLLRTRDAAAFVARCAAGGVLVRDRSTLPGLAGCVRISVGAARDLELMFAALTPAEAFGGSEESP